MGRFRDLTGETFGRLFVLECLGKRNHRTSYFWLCECSCSKKIIEVRGDQLTSDKTRSCGCFQKDSVTRHGFWNTNYDKGTMKFYKMWQSLKARCTNSNLKCYKNYGGRGITYTPNWEEFEGFKKDMYFKYLYAKKQLKIKNPSLERKDVNGNYCKENCCFIEREDQMKNLRGIRKFIAISPEGKKTKGKNVNEFCKKHGLNSSHVYECLKGEVNHHKGWKFKKLD
jgi:hypothetical protein